MTQIGDLFKLPNLDARVFDGCIAASSLLPKNMQAILLKMVESSHWLILWLTSWALVVVERTGSGVENAAAVVPILLVLQKLAQVHSLANCERCNAEEAFQEKVKASK
ncbi:LOW QUALITY PROTEIN: hypothetical protein ACHAWO_008131 [Cyclotella atomus]|uniref:Uncharacterized protein n=1 Tax=Cyclotella atomus TaxID=382360 RepID=A0ABD3NLG9_9STRA